MRAEIHNPTAIPNNTRGELSEPDVTRHVTSRLGLERPTPAHSESFTLTTLGDGHTVPSENATSPSASVKVEKLMDTLFDTISRCYVAVTSCKRGPSKLANHNSERDANRARLGDCKFWFWRPRCQNWGIWRPMARPERHQPALAAASPLAR
jgi:hypothetical protein